MFINQHLKNKKWHNCIFLQGQFTMISYLATCNLNIHSRWNLHKLNKLNRKFKLKFAKYYLLPKIVKLVSPQETLRKINNNFNLIYLVVKLKKLILFKNSVKHPIVELPVRFFIWSNKINPSFYNEISPMGKRIISAKKRHHLSYIRISASLHSRGSIIKKLFLSILNLVNQSNFSLILYPNNFLENYNLLYKH